MFSKLFKLLLEWGFLICSPSVSFGAPFVKSDMRVWDLTAFHKELKGKEELYSPAVYYGVEVYNIILICS